MQPEPARRLSIRRPELNPLWEVACCLPISGRDVFDRIAKIRSSACRWQVRFQGARISFSHHAGKERQGRGIQTQALSLANGIPGATRLPRTIPAGRPMQLQVQKLNHKINENLMATTTIAMLSG